MRLQGQLLRVMQEEGTGSEITGKIQELKKKCTKGVLSNYYLSDEHINEELVNTEFFTQRKMRTSH